MFTQLKAIFAGAILLVVLIIAGLIYWRGSSNATTKADLKVARQTIQRERAAAQVEQTTDARVNAETIKTAQTAQEATHEIASIRTDRARPPVAPVAPADPADAERAARVLQLTREARAAAVESAARLQSAGTSTR